MFSLEDFQEFFVPDLLEMVIELPYGCEVGWCFEADRFICNFCEIFNCIGRSDRKRGDQFFGILLSHGPERGLHCGAGCDAVVCHDHRSIGQLGFVQQFAIGGDPVVDGVQLGCSFLLDVIV